MAVKVIFAVKHSAQTKKTQFNSFAIKLIPLKQCKTLREHKNTPNKK